MTERLFLKQNEVSDFDSYKFPALKRALDMDKKDIIEELKKSGLRGRGGAGFPTGLKWELALKEKAGEKYIICNGDEGEPGTFKDRYLLENSPLKVLEGILIGAYTIGAHQGYIYIRGEYALPINIFRQVIKEAKKRGILGNRVMGSDYSFDLKLIKGAGAYVCGDETSLINSIEGKRGTSRIKPPYPTRQGLFNKPTVVNNVETLAAAAEIILQGADKYGSMGTEQSRGTKLVCLSGDICNPGVYEVEFGTMTIKELIDTFAGGVKCSSGLKFVIPGGISTSVLKDDELDIPYTYEDIEKKGSSLGSGAVVVVSEDHYLPDLMLNVSRFFMDETCGTCFPCREGNRRVHLLLKNKISDGRFDRDEKKLISDIGRAIHLAARCGLGQTSLNFVTSVLNKFEDELMVGRD